MSGLRLVPFVLLLSACGGPRPIEVDGDVIRDHIRRSAAGDNVATEKILALARVSGRGWDLIHRETDRSLLTARLRASAAKEEEASLAGGDPAKLGEATVRRADAETEVARLEALTERLPKERPPRE